MAICEAPKSKIEDRREKIVSVIKTKYNKCLYLGIYMGAVIENYMGKIHHWVDTQGH